MNLASLDLLTFVGFVGLVVVVSLVASRRETGADDYFLAGRSLTWPLIGLSLIASNISTEHFVIYFHRGGERLAARLARIAEETRLRLQPTLGVPMQPIQGQTQLLARGELVRGQVDAPREHACARVRLWRGRSF